MPFGTEIFRQRVPGLFARLRWPRKGLVAQDHKTTSCASIRPTTWFLCFPLLRQNSEECEEVNSKLAILQKQKRKGSAGRNVWQGRVEGGKIATFYGPTYLELLRASRKSFFRKWASNGCDTSTWTTKRSWF